ncbi:helix-turn-helix and ligand-binding sensor domain-containing protein [Polaribacter aquimarinus]|uniref:LuxR family transcriptional regulator n=1 Tax=Polaribacter aquimarinus TaxID=2100726 RepID=A0A2U2J9E2_9FLAO|nr:triple tyrosine motif-containing protein [Polaribacter aquimarinus]PWG04966.1 LuxR family transcriptional regulator [Polaribacter aquimarinus]
MKWFRYLLQVLFLFVSSLVFSQEFPPINIFYTEDYQAENQNWDISQSQNDFIYVANNKGLLEYNGASWKLFETPNETIMRSVKVFENKVFTGFYMGFGFWEKDIYGDLKYNSIVKEQNVKMLEDEQIWQILEIDGWMIFRSLQRIYLYNLSSKEIKVINVANRINCLAKVAGVIYFHEANKGLFKIQNGAPKLVSNDKIVKDNFIVNVFLKDNRLLLLSKENGFFYLNSNGLEKWKIPSENLLLSKTVYSAKQLRDKSFAIGTISNGLIYFNEIGELQYQIKQSSGLSNNTILSILEDKKNNLWLGLDNGINCVNNISPFKMYNKKSDFLGTIYTSIIYKNNIYLGTNQGLFYREINSKDQFKFIKNTQGQVWSLSIIDEELFCGHNSGTFIINNNKADNIFSKEGTWTILKIDNNTILQGCYDGLYILKNNGFRWELKNKIKGFKNSSKFIVLADDNKIFVNHEYKGVYKLTLDKDFTEVINLEIEQTLAKGIHSSILKYRDKILYANKKGVYVYNKEKDSFSKDSLFSNLIFESSFISAKLVYSPVNDKLWAFSKDHIKYLSPGKLSNKPKIKTISLAESIPKAASGYENIIHINNDNYLIGTSNGYIIINLKSLNEVPEFNIYMNEIKSFIIDEPKENLSLTEKSNLKYKSNNLEFFYSVPNYDKTVTTKYQYKLDGFNKSWSKPTSSNSVLFDNLSYGTYVFNVRAIIGGKLSSNVSTYTFKIERPWYLSNLLISIYVLISLFSFYSVHLASKRYYKKQREDLLEKAKRESELKELESSQEIIKLNNEKLRNDIANKNKELATSTMNMIKKNEFLSTIKMELMNGGDRHVTKVIKIIDNNLNNTDDWKMFQEAFNNADKNFLDKVKDKHPNLTPNDLRLCAYLRLNLSSKEIAPLLNISPRSVEVKRYRLRKKMNLSHDSNLTNYILEI